MKEYEDVWIFLKDKKNIVRGDVDITESGMRIEFFTTDEGIEEGDLVAVEAVTVIYDVTQEGRIGKN